MAGAHHRLDVTVISASALPWVEKDRGCDSMVEVSFEGKLLYNCISDYNCMFTVYRQDKKD